MGSRSWWDSTVRATRPRSASTSTTISAGSQKTHSRCRPALQRCSPISDRDRDEPDDPEYKEISLKEAAARWRVALEMTELTFDPPTTEDFDHLRALVLARLATLPVGGKVPQTPSPNDEERDELLAEFLESDEVVGLTGVGDGDSEDTTVEELADQLLTFSLDYALGTPLRFSPVMVEIFCLDWAPRKIPLDGDAFTLLPDVLAAWIRFVGRRRAIPERSIRASVDATYGSPPR